MFSFVTNHLPFSPLVFVVLGGLNLLLFPLRFVFASRACLRFALGSGGLLSSSSCDIYNIRISDSKVFSDVLDRHPGVSRRCLFRFCRALEPTLDLPDISCTTIDVDSSWKRFCALFRIVCKSAYRKSLLRLVAYFHVLLERFASAFSSSVSAVDEFALSRNHSVLCNLI